MYMDTSKLREAMAELQSQRNLLDAAISNIQHVPAMLDSTRRPSEAPGDAVEEKRSYIDDTVAFLESGGKPMHIKAIVEALSELRGVSIPRASLESSIIRHIAKTNGRAKLAKFAPSTFGLSIWNQPMLAKTA
jgi:hypothetical protein